ncbi:MAG: succinyl-diaminopimelate desuccinylase [Gammaproteobacteria bacterium]|nr:succinyl-diaminopimelate desuccinylase [Gammaproteobacteria bacterium]
MSEIELLKSLIQRPSQTPDDADCMGIIFDQLSPLGFKIEWFDHNGVSNCLITHGDGHPKVLLAGHTDVVPTGPEDDWTYPPYSATVVDNILYGRGAADMKSGVAALTIAAKQFVEASPAHQGTLALLLTSDEEGPAIDGTKHVIDQLQARGETYDYCIVGEPSSDRTFGDTIRVGRRGSLSAEIEFHGVQGHVAYPEKCKNPNHTMADFLSVLMSSPLDNGNDYFPPSTLQITNIHSGTGTHNVVPNRSELWLNIRFNTEHTAAQLKARIENALADVDANYSIQWRHTADPFLTEQGKLIAAAQASITEACNLTPALSTAGGTSDGRFIAPTGTEVIELGVRNETIHQINENVDLAEVHQAREVYLNIIQRLLNQ